MSLLIKALDNAEKNKQAEKNKKQAAERIVESPLSLELTPIESEPANEANQTPAQNIAEQPVEAPQMGLVDKPVLAAAAATATEADMSLEEEAGLNASPMAVKKYTKSKPEQSPASAQSNTIKASPEEPQVAVKPKAVGTVPMSNAPIFQPRPATVEANQKAAAKVFVANQAAKSPSSKYALLLLGIAGALMIWLGLQGYGYIKALLAPDVVVVKPVAPPPVAVVDAAAPTETLPAEAAPAQDELAALPTAPIDAANAATAPAEAGVAADGNQATESQVVSNSSVTDTKIAPDSNVKTNSNVLVVENDMPKAARNKKARNDDTSLSDSESSPMRREPLKLTSKAATPGVDPTLLAAYQAFNRGEDALAQQQYRQVLQRDVRSVDALLGMAAIAQRQGRDADAAGWFQKVLEIEPRNAIAQSAMMNVQTSNDIVGTESRIKNMLAQQPEGANLHAALGNLYAEQNRWALAQEAYFNASRYAPNNADFAFNLAISLDQLGKSNLALKQYQRALDLINQSGASSPDRVLLETRIKALQ